MTGFEQYLAGSLKGVLTNDLFTGLVLGILVQDIRSSKYLSWERFVREEGISGDWKRVLLYLASYVFAVPIALIGFTIIIFFLWLLSFIVS